jgi:hypothetical protein
VDGFVDSAVEGQVVLVVGQAEVQDVESACAFALVNSREDRAKGAQLGGADFPEGGWE